MRVVFAFICLLAVGGCASFGVAETASIMATKKTLGDNVVSLYTGKNCSTVRYEKGLTYCEEDEPKPPASKVYCYRTLGAVNCYERPDPYGDQARPLGAGNSKP